MSKLFFFFLLALPWLTAYAQDPPITGTTLTAYTYQNQSLLAETSVALLPGFAVSTPGFSATVGKPYAVGGHSEGVFNWGFIAIHNHLLPNGKIIAWEGHNNGYHLDTHTHIWDPATDIPDLFPGLSSKMATSASASSPRA